MIDTIDSIESIVNWSAFLPSGICLVSSASAKEVARDIRRALPNTRFLVVEIEPGKKNGWLPKNVWRFINEPKPVAG
jgi:hypothetical protein